MPPDQVDLNRARGLLWGQAIGDALGTTQEFTVPRNRKPFPELNLGPQTDIVGGGRFSLQPGETTDDTQMAVCLAESLAEMGRWEAADAARRYVEWMGGAFDVGNQTRAALSLIQRGQPAEEAGFAVWEAARRLPAGNGSLMRVSPAAAYFAEDAAGLRRAALEDSAITHADPRCRLACAALVAAARHALVSGEATAVTMRAAAEEELAVAAGSLGARTPEEIARRAAEELAEDLRLAGGDDPELDSREAHLYRTAGFVRVAFRLAFWELLHAPDFSACVLDCANRGGDADTNAAIAGALYGALAGEAAIPEGWRRVVRESGARGGVDSWAGRYQARKLFCVLEKFEGRGAG